MRRATAISVRIYGLVARTFPEEFRALHGRELMETSGDLIDDVAARQGLTGLLALMLRILADLIARVVSEHVSSLGRDTRYALRVLKGSPAFTLTAVISVGLGIGIATSVYGQLNSMIFSPVPGVSQPESLVATAGTVSFPVYEAFVAQESPFLSAAAFIGTVPLAWSEIADRPSTRLWGEVVTSNYFEVLGTPMRVGGGLSSADLRADAVVLSERFWDRELNRDPGVVGDAIRLNGKLLTVAGVAAEGFLGARPLTGSADAWIPITNDLSIIPEVDRDTFENASHKPFAVVGRIEQGVGIDEAEVQLDTIAKRFEQPSALNEIQNRVRTVALIHGGRRLPISDRDLPFVIAVPGVFVLLMLGIACANVGTLLLAKTGRRRREIAVRLALGASRLRILRQVLIESLLVGLMAGIVGYAIALTYGVGLNSQAEAGRGYLNTQLFELDWTALIFTLAVSTGSALMFGLAPAVHAIRVPVLGSLKAGATWKLEGFRWFSFRNLLVLQQVVGSLAMLLITGFVVLGISRNTSLDPLFDTRGLFMTSLDPVRDGYSPDQAEQLLSGLPQRIRGLPGVVDAALSFDVPIGPLSSGTEVRVRNTGFNEAAAQLQTVRTASVSPGFLETLGLPILAGRTLEEQDQSTSRTVANETLAAQMWPDQNAVGQTLEIDEQRFEIIGVVADLHPGGMFASTQPTLFRAISEEDYAKPGPFGLTLVLRGNGSTDVMSSVTDMLASSDPQIALFNSVQVQDEIDQSLSFERETLTLYGGIGLFGLLLATVSIAGVTSYSVAQRNKEIGIRTALGASRMRIIGLVTREAAGLVVSGTIIGLGVAYGTTRILAAWFEGIAQATGAVTTDPLLVFGAPALLGMLAFVACYLPTRRALRVQPAVVLRSE